MRNALAFAAVCVLPAQAWAHAFSVETSAARGYLALQLTGDVELRADETFLTLCYGVTRPPAIEALTPEVPAVVPALSHQLCAGVDHALSSHWYLAALATASPRTTDRVPLVLTNQLALVTSRQSLGGTLSLAYDSAGLSDWEWTADGSLSATFHRLGRGGAIGTQVELRQVPLAVLRPALGATLIYRGDTDLSLRGSYFTYSANPLTAGRFTEAELRLVQDKLANAALEAGARLERILAGLELLDSRLLQADAVSGFAAAPIQFELKASLSHRFHRRVRGQLSYVYDKYVPTQGQAHILSTKWTFKLAERLRVWGALALQRDMPVEAPAEAAGLATLGAELSF
ncbi:MAG: hypothetical protein ACOZIN_16280 [Myxococcota bacterium]